MTVSNFIDDPIVELILELFYNQTNIPISLFYGDKIIQPSSYKWPDFCKLAHKKAKLNCQENLMKRANVGKPSLSMCHAGLWNYVIPLKNDEKKVVGALFTSQRRIIIREQESIKALENFSKKVKLSDDEHKEFLNLFFQVTEMPNEEIFSPSINLLYEIESRLYILLSTHSLERKKIVNLAHQILLPMQSIIANAENLQVVLNPLNKEYAQKAEEILLRLSELGLIVDNMRSNLLDNKNEKYQFEEHQINSIILDVISIFKYQAAKKNLDFNVEVETDTIPVAYYHIRRALFNLIHNSIKYSYEGLQFGGQGKERYVKIRGTVRKGWYKLSIENYGIGILECELDEICNDGVRGILSSDRERTGSGIGLSEVKRIIEKHGGHLKIESDLLGDDMLYGPYRTTVTIELPRGRHGRL